jgi:acetoacetyl-CoA synthetase
MAVDVFDDDGRPVRGEKGELVCTQSFPVMPIGFWNDGTAPSTTRPTSSASTSVWCHGDFAEITGARRLHHLRPFRRDAQPGRRAHRHRRDLPPGGEARRSRRVLVIGQDWPPGNAGDVRVVLFVKLREGLARRGWKSASSR